MSANLQLAMYVRSAFLLGVIYTKAFTSLAIVLAKVSTDVSALALLEHAARTHLYYCQPQDGKWVGYTQMTGRY